MVLMVGGAFRPAGLVGRAFRLRCSYGGPSRPLAKVVRPAICAALALIGLGAPSRAAAQTPTLASTSD